MVWSGYISKVVFTDVATNVRFRETNVASSSHGVHQYTQTIGWVVRQQRLESRLSDHEIGEGRSHSESGPLEFI